MLVPKCGRFTLIITDSLDYQKLELYSIILPHSRIYDIIEHPQSHGLYCRLTCQKKRLEMVWLILYFQIDWI